MKTEISRESHQPEKRYSGVYQQQGRMLTDADWNELVEILKKRLNDALKDVVGSKAGSVGGTPRHRALKIVNDVSDTFKIKPGNLYIDGVAALIPGDTTISYDAQPDFPLPPNPTGDYVLYADVWERTITHLMDERLRDKGLHGADTCTRKQMMAQIKWCPDDVDPELSEKNPSRGNANLTLTLLAKSTRPDICDPCTDTVEVKSRVGNYLFRVEVHHVEGEADNPTSITLKWSSENGAEQFEALPTKEMMAAGFISDKWVYEFFDNTTEKHLGNHLENTSWEPARGVLSEIKEPMSPYFVPVIPGSGEAKQLVRRWDGYCTFNLSSKILTEGLDRGVTLSTEKNPEDLGFVKIDSSLRIVLGSISLDLLLDAKSFVSGDYWLAEVREFEHEAGSVLIQEKVPQGIEHRYLKLGKVLAGNLQENPETDRKYSFPPLTEMTRMFHVGGDGQEALPSHLVPQSLKVGVANGEWPVAGVKVEFSVTKGDGKLLEHPDFTLENFDSGNPISGIATTDGGARNGRVHCLWEVGPGGSTSAEKKQRVTARLVDPASSPGDAAYPRYLDHPPVHFSANLSTADQVAYTPGCPGELNTVHSLLDADDGNVVWPKLDEHGHSTVKDVLDTVLCALKAKHIPYDPTEKKDRWEDVNFEEGAEIPVTVQGAIDDLVDNLQSEDIKYTPACTGDTPPTVRSKLGIPTTTSRVHEILDKLLCNFTAAQLPLDKTDAKLCEKLKKDEQVTTIQDAVNVLCERKSGERCCRITISPGDDFNAKLSTIGVGEDAHICITQGEYKVTSSILLENKGHISLQGCGGGTRVLAPTSESVFLFRNCKSVTVRDIILQSGRVGTKGNYRNLRGALGIHDVERVTVDAVGLACPAAGERSASCLTISYTSPNNKKASIRVRHSQMNPGHHQIGMLLVNVGRAHIEDNEIQVRRKSRHWVFKEKIKYINFRKAVRRMMINNVSSHADISRNISLSGQGFTIHFSTDPTLAEAWTEYVLKIDPPKPGLKKQEFIRYLKTSADTILLTLSELGDNSPPSPSTQSFLSWFQYVRSFLPAVAGQGIVCAGRSAADVRIVNNSIQGVAQGVHIGLSHNELKGYVPYQAGRVQVTGNHLVIYVAPENYGGRHGIFVGNCESLDIEGNHLKLERFPRNLVRPIDGVRVYGHLGKMIQIQKNHMIGFNTGVFVRAVKPALAGSQLWQISSNMIEEGVQSVDVAPFTLFRLDNNIT